MRTDGEGRGPGEKGRLRNRLGRRRLFAQGPRSSRLPSRLRSAPPLSRVPTPLPIPPQRRVRGNTLLGDFWYPSKCAACAFPEPWRPPATSPYNLAGHPTGYVPQHGSDEDPHHASAVPQPGTRLSGDLDPAGRAPERTERTGNLCTKGRHSRVDLEPGGTSLKVGAPQSTYTPRGPWEEVQWSQEEGRGSLGGGGTETQTGGQAGVATALSTDNGAREGGAGRSPAKGGASPPSFPRGTLVGLLSCCGNPLALCCLSPETFTRFLSCSPGEAGCPDPLLQQADPGRRPVTQAPRGTWGGSGSCLESDPPFPSLAAPPHAFSFPGRSLLPWQRRRLPGPGV